MSPPTRTNESVATPSGKKFKTIAKHRTPTNVNIASQWDISIPDEYNTFLLSHAESNSLGWGSYIINNKLCRLGHDNTDKLFFAKFVCENTFNEWHGYPINPTRGPSDIPSDEYLGKLQEDECITVAKMNKIKRGQRCNM